MNIESMFSNMTPEKLEAGLLKLSGVLSDEQMRQIKQFLGSTDKKEIEKQLRNMDMNEVKNQPEFKKFFPNK